MYTFLVVVICAAAASCPLSSSIEVKISAPDEPGCYRMVKDKMQAMHLKAHLFKVKCVKQ